MTRLRTIGVLIILLLAAMPAMHEKALGAVLTDENISNPVALGPINNPQTTSPPGKYIRHVPGTPLVGPVHAYYGPDYYAHPPSPGSGANNSTGPTSNPCSVPDCNPLSYWQNGRVLNTGTYAFNIFWQPYNPTSYSWFDWRMNTFFSDVNQTGYYGNMTQYYCNYCGINNFAYITNSSALAASWQDTRGYLDNPLTEADIHSEINYAIQQNGWNLDSNSQINVILGAGVTWPNCGEHGSFYGSGGF